MNREIDFPLFIENTPSSSSLLMMSWRLTAISPRVKAGSISLITRLNPYNS